MCHWHVLLWYRGWARVLRMPSFIVVGMPKRVCCYFIIYMRVWARALCSYLFVDVGVHEHVLLLLLACIYIRYFVRWISIHTSLLVGASLPLIGCTG